MTFETWDPSDIWSEWCPDKKTKRQEDKKTKRKKKKKQKESLLLWCQSSFSLLRCFNWWLKPVRMSIEDDAIYHISLFLTNFIWFGLKIDIVLEESVLPKKWWEWALGMMHSITFHYFQSFLSSFQFFVHCHRLFNHHHVPQNLIIPRSLHNQYSFVYRFGKNI